MNVVARISRQALLKSRYCALRRGTSVRFGSSAHPHHEPLYPAGTFNIVARKGHGFMNYFRQWEALIFCHKDYRWATFWIWAPSVYATAIMFYVIWNSAWRDPEVRLRPHKKGWHLDANRYNGRGEKYRGGSMIWVPGNRHRMEWNREKMRNGWEDQEPGQIGWEEAPIPRLDDDDE
eukprot:CAMPEP_0197021074 /NCGR_PEP_ID=MMETSP1384-20130603/1967_1 /TAXON_ID=29189 /ORGANISM="Ammonia sp." /LENGTH=176 /DNA_ID=CAMNT_0042448825 /DNA_START=66 /DNA_END=596 /DNA_ORIENTATION=+